MKSSTKKNGPHHGEVRFLTWCARRDLNPYVVDTRTSNVPVCQFQHSRITNVGYYSIQSAGCQAEIFQETENISREIHFHTGQPASLA